jgi:hypothetical protein
MSHSQLKAHGGTTVTVALPIASPALAEMVALPADMPVTRPVAEHVATAVLALDHVRDPQGAPVASRDAPLSCRVSPTSIVASDGVTRTVAGMQAWVPSSPQAVKKATSPSRATDVRIDR